MRQGVAATKTLFLVLWPVDARIVIILMEVDHHRVRQKEHDGIIYCRIQMYQLLKSLLKKEMKP